MKKWLGWLACLLIVGLLIYGGMRWVFPDMFGNKSTLSAYVEATDDTQTTFLVKEAAGTFQVTTRTPDEEKKTWLSNAELVNDYTGDWTVTIGLKGKGQDGVVESTKMDDLSVGGMVTSDLAYAAYIPYATANGNEVGLFVATDDQEIIKAIQKDPQSAEEYKEKAEIRYIGIETASND
ncbi:hypothetical protein [Enterococcus sp. RIT-PI-f]|uniref:hypothetical protein n=1 Tax=Enterococcus sp. RIT-PI-f TaxID=1690244 RepID=UPI0006BA09BF|nr:hypothetical protein [Enterococcus sp. RIT-PI-f]KPG71543.1 hypothetical protein AEQ18_05085 [Enterococcus sp. RIT-PI-f]